MEEWSFDSISLVKGDGVYVFHNLWRPIGVPPCNMYLSTTLRLS